MAKVVDKIKVILEARPDTGEVPVVDVVSLAAEAGWSDDPGTGKAFHTPDGREVLNPAVLDPPVGFEAAPSVMEMIQRELDRRQAILDDAEIVEESAEDASDFPEDVESEIRSVFEFMEDDFPGKGTAGPEKALEAVVKPEVSPAAEAAKSPPSAS